MAWTRPVDLKTWADRIEARHLFPEIVRRLINATCEKIERLDFPSAEEVQRRGWDGVATVGVGNPFVPPGTSGWELGTGSDAQAKAKADFETRTQDSLSLERGETTFVFATPRSWHGKGEWVNEAKASHQWKDVRVCDSSDFAQWLELAPAVDVWFAIERGVKPPGVCDLIHHWKNLASLAHPELKPSVFLASRAKEKELVTEWLSRAPDELAFEATSPVEVLDFFAAFIASLSDTERHRFENRALIVEEREAWRQLAVTQSPLTLIASPRLPLEGELIAEAVRHGHHVLVASSRLPGSQTSKGRLARSQRYDLEKALEESGLQKEASRLARESGGSLSVLKRLLGKFHGTQPPPWSLPVEAQILAPFVLAGGWVGENPDDQTILGQLHDKPYAEVKALAERAASGEDPLLMHVLGCWSLVSREDSWLMLSPALRKEHLDRFAAGALTVLSETDPQYDLPSSERWTAAIHRKLTRHSPSLRHGMAETLAVAGALCDQVGTLTSQLGMLTQSLVQRLLNGDFDWKRWASLSPLLPLLAEASPEAFLGAVENDLNRGQPAVLGLFGQEGDPLFSSSPHTGLLWALESLAWEPAYLLRVGLILARLAREDPGGRLLNRPMNSLRETFLLWYPHTSANREQRLRVLDRIVAQEPNVGWQLLLSLLPQFHEVSDPRHQPYWRQWGERRPPRLTQAEYDNQVEEVARRLLALASEDTTRWEQLLDKLEHLPRPAFEQVLKWLEETQLEQLTSVVRARIWDKLRQKITDHRYFEDPKRAMSKADVDRLDAVMQRFEPSDMAMRYAWLFSHRARLLRESRTQTWQEIERVRDEARKRAVEEVWQAGGFDLLIRLSENAEVPGMVGVVSSKAGLPIADERVFPSLLTAEVESHRLFARGFAVGRLETKGEQWLDELPLKSWDADQAVQLLILIHPMPKTWRRVAELGSAAQEKYWQSVQSVFPPLPAEDLEAGVRQLLAHHRPFAAASVLFHAVFQKEPVAWELVMEVLESGLRQPEAGVTPEPLKSVDWHEVQGLFEHLQSQPNVDTERLARLEWGYLPILSVRDITPKTLHAAINKDPNFFVELLTYTYRSRNEPEGEIAEPTEEERNRARLAYELIRSWDGIPGRTEAGSIDPAALQDWVNKARNLTREGGRLEVCDVILGEMLARTRDEDITWPCLAIRELIEKIDSGDLGRGFSTGIYNLRGTYMKSISEGGEQEWKFAAKYTRYAEGCVPDWPKTASILREVAKSYEAEARGEDEKVGRPPDYWQQLQRLKGKITQFRVEEPGARRGE